MSSGPKVITTEGLPAIQSENEISQRLHISYLILLFSLFIFFLFLKERLVEIKVLHPCLAQGKTKIISRS